MLRPPKGIVIDNIGALGGTLKTDKRTWRQTKSSIRVAQYRRLDRQSYMREISCKAQAFVPKNLASARFSEQDSRAIHMIVCNSGTGDNALEKVKWQKNPPLYPFRKSVAARVAAREAASCSCRDTRCSCSTSNHDDEDRRAKQAAMILRRRALFQAGALLKRERCDRSHSCCACNLRCCHHRSRNERCNHRCAKKHLDSQLRSPSTLNLSVGVAQPPGYRKPSHAVAFAWKLRGLNDCACNAVSRWGHPRQALPDQAARLAR